MCDNNNSHNIPQVCLPLGLMTHCKFVDFVNETDYGVGSPDIYLSVDTLDLHGGTLFELVDILELIVGIPEQMVDILEQFEGIPEEIGYTPERYLDSPDLGDTRDFVVGRDDQFEDIRMPQGIRAAARDSPLWENPPSASDFQTTVELCCKIQCYVDIAVADTPIGP